jgi:hypothetical protein
MILVGVLFRVLGQGRAVVIVAGAACNKSPERSKSALRTADPLLVKATRGSALVTVAKGVAQALRLGATVGWSPVAACVHDDTVSVAVAAGSWLPGAAAC